MSDSREDLYTESVEMHRKYGGKVEIRSKVPLENQHDLSLAYTPGVARVCELIAKDPSLARELTIKKNTIGIITDGSAVLGLGNIGPEAALPVMEGKAILFREFAGVDAIPLCLDTQDVDEIVTVVKALAPGLGGINLEDIAAPRCFEIEAQLQDLGIPVFHDDQHGTAIVVQAALINAARALNKPYTSLNVVISGAGAAGRAIAHLLTCFTEEDAVGLACTAIKDVVVCDSKGAIYAGRPAQKTNRGGKKGSLKDVLKDANVFIGVSKGDILGKEDIESMADDPIVLALANPIPEVHPDVATAAGAGIVGTGRSDYPNQVNNVLAFPGIFRGALDAGATRITYGMKLAAANALADSVETPAKDAILPNALDRSVGPRVAKAVEKAWNDLQRLKSFEEK
ncbi:MAG: NADP-dependent malic enzyme [Planctomycetota bacterium]|nr:NADP-dependent malic enzyme [Planctomycetota bacterium]